MADWPQSEGDSTGPVLKLEGPASLLARFESFMVECAAARTDAKQAARMGTQQLWPIFVLSRGRAARAHLNWEADHVLGSAGALSVVVVVAPEEQVMKTPLSLGWQRPFPPSSKGDDPPPP